MTWQKKMSARAGREIELSVSETGIRLSVEGVTVGLTMNMAGDLSHALDEAQEHLKSIGGRS